MSGFTAIYSEPNRVEVSYISNCDVVAENTGKIAKRIIIPNRIGIHRRTAIVDKVKRFSNLGADTILGKQETGQWSARLNAK